MNQETVEQETVEQETVEQEIVEHELEFVDSQEDNQIVIINNIPPSYNPASDLRVLSLYGDVTEELAADIVAGLLLLGESPHEPDPEDKRGIKLFISTHGGSVSDMFSIIDVMNMIQARGVDIETVGLGKVMSAGVLLLAAGTKGKRKIGKNCRLMLHGVSAGSVGPISTMENELAEFKWIQNRFVSTLSKHSNLKKSKIKKMLKSHKDIYISAKDAIKLGIADEIA